MAFDDFMSGAKKFGSGVLQGTFGTDFGLGGGPTAVGAAAVKRTPNQTAPVGTKAPANPQGVEPYMKPGILQQGMDAIGGLFDDDEDDETKAKIAEGTQAPNRDGKHIGPIGGPASYGMDKPEFDKTIGKSPDSETEDSFNLQDFGRLLASVSGGNRNKGGASMPQAPVYRGQGNYKSKGLWDQRITKEWMDIYNKPLYTPLHKVAAAAMR